MAELAHNSYQDSTGMPLFEALYRRKYISSLCWELGEVMIWAEMVMQLVKKVIMLHDWLTIAKDR